MPFLFFIFFYFQPLPPGCQQSDADSHSKIRLVRPYNKIKLCTFMKNFKVLAQKMVEFIAVGLLKFGMPGAGGGAVEMSITQALQQGPTVPLFSYQLVFYQIRSWRLFIRSLIRSHIFQLSVSLSDQSMNKNCQMIFYQIRSKE